jgi:hypothetical protein
LSFENALLERINVIVHKFPIEMLYCGSEAALAEGFLFNRLDFNHLGLGCWCLDA